MGSFYIPHTNVTIVFRGGFRIFQNGGLLFLHLLAAPLATRILHLKNAEILPKLGVLILVCSFSFLFLKKHVRVPLVLK